MPVLSGIRRVFQRAWIWPVSSGLIGIAASITGLRNQYTQDDIAIIWKNNAVHTWQGIGALFTSSYWPPPFVPALYRPLATLSFALQWILGGGSPLVFRIVSYLLYAAVAVAVFRLAQLRLPRAAAFMAAALFAVHPLHVEAVAVAVNQSELWVGWICCIAVVWYVRLRARGGSFSTADQLRMAGLYLIGCLFKESALVLPGLLIAAELLLVESAEPVRKRLAEGRSLLLLMLLVAVSFYWVRTQVLSGSLSGTTSAEALVGLSMGQRALTMLGVVPDLVRLMFWPAHLRADYSPGEIVGATQWGSSQSLGVAILAGVIIGAVAARRRAPVVSFGLAWCAIGFFPVHNVLVMTGIVLAERTLFLPSIGVCIAIAGVLALVIERVGAPVRRLLAVSVAGLVILGLYRSNLRHRVWSDQFNLWYQTANVDAPRSFRAHHALAETYFNIGVEALSEKEYRLAIRYAPPVITSPRGELADRLRGRGFCFPAIGLYRNVLAVHPDNMLARASLIACMLDLGWYRQAALHARLGISYDFERPVFQAALATADSALRVTASPGTVRVDGSKSVVTAPYWRIAVPRPDSR